MNAKQIRAAWQRLAKAVGPGRKPSARDTDERWARAMADVKLGRDPYPPLQH